MAKLKSDLLDGLTIKAAKPKEKGYSFRDGNCLFCQWFLYKSLMT